MSRRRKQAKLFLKSLSDMLAKERLYPWMLGASVLLWLLTLALPLWRIVPLAGETPFLPLHYNVYFGVDRFGPWWQVFVPNALGLLFLCVALSMQARFFRREPLLSRFFSISTVLIEATFFVAMVLLVLLNI